MFLSTVRIKSLASVGKYKVNISLSNNSSRAGSVSDFPVFNINILSNSEKQKVTGILLGLQLKAYLFYLSDVVKKEDIIFLLMMYLVKLFNYRLNGTVIHGNSKLRNWRSNWRFL